MLNLLPFRVSRFPDGNVGRIEDLLDIGRQDSDRSQFVRYAKMTQTWLHWVQEGIVVESSEAALVDFEDFEYGIAKLNDLIPLQSVIPVEKESEQRILEALSVCLTPIVVDSFGRVCDHHVAYHAAKGLQAELARPGRVRASDYALVARAKNVRFEHPVLSLVSSVEPAEALKRLEQFGWKSDRSDYPFGFRIEFGGKKLFRSLEEMDWQVQIEQSFGIRKLDLNLKLGVERKESGEQYAEFQVETSASFSENNDFASFHLAPAGSVALDKRPKIGHIMWSSRSFSPSTT